LDQIQENVDVFFKLQYEFDIYQDAKIAIRGGKLKAHLEESIYYLPLTKLLKWFSSKNLWVHPCIVDFFNLRYGPKKKGRPQHEPEILLKIANAFHENGVKKIGKADLRKHELIQPLVKAYIADKKTKEAKDRGLNTLRDNANKILRNFSS